MTDPSRDTVRFDEIRWLPPVESVNLLPVEGVSDGALCYVQGEDAVYTLTNGIWVKGADMAMDSGSLPPGKKR